MITLRKLENAILEHKKSIRIHLLEYIHTYKDIHARTKTSHTVVYNIHTYIHTYAHTNKTHGDLAYTPIEKE